MPDEFEGDQAGEALSGRVDLHWALGLDSLQMLYQRETYKEAQEL